MRIAYKPGVRCTCHGLAKEFAEPSCGHLDGPSAEQVVVQAFFAAIQPAQVGALAALMTRRREERAQVERHWAQQLQRISHEAHLARQRYEAVDPANRLVAAELERRWEAALVLQRETQRGWRKRSPGACLCRELGADKSWLYRRIYSGALCAPDVVRKPPYGHGVDPVQSVPEPMMRCGTLPRAPSPVNWLPPQPSIEKTSWPSAGWCMEGRWPWSWWRPLRRSRWRVLWPANSCLRV